MGLGRQKFECRPDKSARTLGTKLPKKRKAQKMSPTLCRNWLSS